MNNYKKPASLSAFPAFCFLLFFSIPAHAQVINDSVAIARADTVRFSPNEDSGWVLYNSYVSHDVQDSVSFEVIVQHEKLGIDWATGQHIGNIKDTALFPLLEQSVMYHLLADSYTVRIATDGKCYLSLSNGSLPPGDPVVIPVQVKYYYKNN